MHFQGCCNLGKELKPVCVRDKNHGIQATDTVYVRYRF